MPTKRIAGFPSCSSTPGTDSHHGAMSIAFARRLLRHHRHQRGQSQEAVYSSKHFSCFRTIWAGCLNIFCFSQACALLSPSIPLLCPGFPWPSH